VKASDPQWQGASESDSEYARPNEVHIDLTAIRRCAQAIRGAIGPSARFFATVKANAYGFGLLPVARTALDAGADALSLVSVSDAVRLREAGVSCPILLYAGAPLTSATVAACERFRLIPTLHDEPSFDALLRETKGPLECAIKIDAGQERVGVPAEEAGEFIARVARSGKLRVAIVNTHPYVSGGPDADAALQWQFERFSRACRDAEARGARIPLRIMASSKVLRMTREMNLDGVDPGQALFTLLDGGTDCQPFGRLSSRLLEVKPVHRTQFLNQAPFGERPVSRLGIAPIGYSDGIHRLNAGVALVRGQRAAILGPPSIEYTRIDLSGVPDAACGDEVVFIGTQHDEQIRAEEVMRAQGTARITDLAVEVRPTIRRIYVNG
jgi:alanine racemase